MALSNLARIRRWEERQFRSSLKLKIKKSKKRVRKTKKIFKKKNYNNNKFKKVKGFRKVNLMK